MRSTLGISALYLSCAVQAVQKPAAVIVDLRSAPNPSLEEVISETAAEPSFKEVIRVVTNRFSQILRDHQWQSLEGTIFLDNSDDLFSYEYDTSDFCSLDSSERYDEKLTLTYYSSKQMEARKVRTTTTIITVPPFSSVNQVEVSLKGEGAEADTYTYYTTGEAQQLYEHMLRVLYWELERYSSIHSTLDEFNLKRTVPDPGWATYNLHRALHQKLESQELLPSEKIVIYNKCEEL